MAPMIDDETLDDLNTPLKEAVQRWDQLGWPRPTVALVSGSGLAVDMGDLVRGPLALEYFLPFSCHPVEGHPHEVDVLLPRPDRPVFYQRGRLHSYQGYSANETVFPIRLAALLGVKTLVLTNATGGLQPHHRPGDLILIRDQINLTGLNPLRGQLPPEWGPRFLDMTRTFDAGLRDLARRKAAELGIELKEGVYIGLAGPTYETPAEVNMLRLLGGDVTGMSTVMEVIAARHMGLRMLCISMVSNAAAGMTEEAIDHADVLAAAGVAAEKLKRLLGEILRAPELV